MANGDDGDDGRESVASRIKGVRDRLEKRRAKKRTKQKSEDLKAERERRARERRIEENEPEDVREGAAAASKELKLLASELGVSTDRARGIVDRASEQVQQFGDQLDTDGDGDTDILTALEDGLDEPASGTRSSGRKPQGSRGGDGFEPPVGEVEDDIEELGGIEEELGLDEPIEDQQGDGLF